MPLKQQEPQINISNINVMNECLSSVMYPMIRLLQLCYHDEWCVLQTVAALLLFFLFGPPVAVGGLRLMGTIL